MAQSLFRSIRMKLLDEGKTFKYLKYAIGEIVLIIVGIMIALQLNNWNEDRKAQEEFDAYVVQLREDVKLAISLAEERVLRAELRTKHTLTVLRVVNGSEIDKDELEEFENTLATFSSFHFSNVLHGHLAQLLNGNLEGVNRDKKLSRQVMLMTRDLEAPLTRLSQLGKNRERALAIIEKYRAPSFNSEPVILLAYDIELLRTSKEFKYAVQNWLSWINMIRTLYRDLSINLEDFLTVLEEYE